jgi:hypothetical protein
MRETGMRGGVERHEGLPLLHGVELASGAASVVWAVSVLCALPWWSMVTRWWCDQEPSVVE